jgi:hypothetical protein
MFWIEEGGSKIRLGSFVIDTFWQILIGRSNQGG